MSHSLDNRIWFIIISLSLKDSLTLLDIWIFFMLSIILSWLEISNLEVSLSLDASSYSFKIFCIMLRQVISIKKMVISSAKFNFLISWSYFFNQLNWQAPLLQQCIIVLRLNTPNQFYLRFLFSLFDTSIISRIIKRVFKTVLLFQ